VTAATCIACGEALQFGSRADRRACSTRCRVAAWRASGQANPSRVEHVPTPGSNGMTAAVEAVTSVSDARGATSLPIDAIRVGARHRKNLGDIDALATSIAAVGLLQPIGVSPDGTLIFGARRLAAVRKLGWREVLVRVLDLDEVLRAEADENTIRLDFAPSEAVAIAEALRAREEGRARERMVAAHASPGKLPELTEGRTRDKVAAAVGMSGRTYEKARVVVEAADSDPRNGDLVARMDRTGKVDPAFRALRRRRIVEHIEAEPVPLPAGPFRVIAADPPWAYANDSDDSPRRSLAPYPSMSLAQIAALPVESIAHPDSILWLWTTNTHLEYAYGIVRAWGFEQRTILTWVKDRMGTGDWLRGQTEHCLFCVRGHPPVTLTNQTTVLYAPMREHSRKPDEFFTLVESLCPGSKLELFARQARPGWAAWGAEAA
jgi:N6-adenosine-specific RNA methylase IME4/ParB-like chromosome segregation protein Spo0J